MLPFHQVGGDPFGIHELFFMILSTGSAVLLWLSAAALSFRAQMKRLIKKESKKDAGIPS